MRIGDCEHRDRQAFLPASWESSFISGLRGSSTTFSPAHEEDEAAFAALLLSEAKRFLFCFFAGDCKQGAKGTVLSGFVGALALTIYARVIHWCLSAGHREALNRLSDGRGAGREQVQRLKRHYNNMTVLLPAMRTSLVNKVQ